MTLRELLAMAEGRQREQWSRLSALMALVANTQRDPKKTRALKPADFDPFARQFRGPPIKADVSVLKSVFIDQRMPKEVLEQ